jgi:putative membrane protein
VGHPARLDPFRAPVHDRARFGDRGRRSELIIDASILPSVNATLNATAACLLTAGFWCIRHRHVRAHRFFMVAAFVVSSLFLASYLYYHYQVGSVAFTGQGWVRGVYFVILITHIVLAAVILPLALTTLYRALRGRWELHKRIARITLPVWLYVSVTGVVIYWMLYGL